MPENSLVHNKDAFKRNVPIATNENVPLSELGHNTCRRKSIPKRKIEELAIKNTEPQVKVLSLQILQEHSHALKIKLNVY